MYSNILIAMRYKSVYTRQGRMREVEVVWVDKDQLEVSGEVNIGK